MNKITYGIIAKSNSLPYVDDVKFITFLKTLIDDYDYIDFLFTGTSEFNRLFLSFLNQLKPKFINKKIHTTFYKSDYQANEDLSNIYDDEINIKNMNTSIIDSLFYKYELMISHSDFILLYNDLHKSDIISHVIDYAKINNKKIINVCKTNI